MAIFEKKHVNAIAKTLASDANLQQSTISLFEQMFRDDNPQFNSFVFEKYIKRIQKGDDE